MILVLWCAAKKVVKSAVNCLVICAGCATVLCCKAYGGGDFQAASSPAADTQGFSGAPTGSGMVAFTAGMATAAAVIKTGLILDDAVVAALTDPKTTHEKKKALRRLNIGYSLAKLGLIAGIARGFSWYVDQCDREGDRAQGVLGGVSAASLVLMSLAKTVWV